MRKLLNILIVFFAFSLLMPAYVFAAGSNTESAGSDKPAVSTNFAYNASYIKTMESKGIKFRVRMPCWFDDAFPKADFKVGKKTTKVTIPIYDPDGKKLITKSLKLNTDSYLWLGNYEDNDYYECPPWLNRFFDEAVVERIEKNALTENGQTYDMIITWIPVYKNAKAKKTSESVITRMVEYFTPQKYNISNIETAKYTHEGGFGICPTY